MMMSQGIEGPVGWPFEERALLMHWMAERRSENEIMHLSHVLVLYTVVLIPFGC